MKQLLVVLVSVSFSFISIAQVEQPYYVSFENWYSDPSSNCELYPMSYCDWAEQEMDTDRIDLTSIDPFYGKTLKIRVEPEDHYLVNGDTMRTRAEIVMPKDLHNLYINQTRYYSWDLFIPNNYQFPETVNGGYYNIMQWHPGSTDDTYCAGTSQQGIPPILLQYVMPTSVGGIDTKRDLRLYMGTNYGGACATDICTDDPFSRGSKSFLIKDAIKLGEWQHIVFHIKWSHDGDDAYIYININGKHVIDADSDPNYYDCGVGGNNDLKLATAGESPFKLTGVPLLYTKDYGFPNTSITNNDILQNSQKLGHYRGGDYNTTNKLFIDNYRITLRFPPAPFRTNLIANDCDKTLRTMDDYILDAHDIEPSDTFIFQFKDGLNYEYSAGHTTPQMNLFTRPWARAGKTYEVQVRALNSLNGNTGFSYGKVCQIVTPHITQLSEEYCGAFNLASPIISCDPIIGTTTYKFQFTQGFNTYYYNSPTPDVDLSQLSWFVFGVTYNVKIRALTATNPGGYSYGAVCSFRVNATSKVSNLNDPSLKALLYPNPTSNEVTVQLSEDIGINQIQLLNSFGETLLTEKNANQVSLVGLRSDIYFLRIHTEKGILVEKVIKF